MTSLDKPTITIQVEDLNLSLQAFGGEKLADLFDMPSQAGGFFMCCRKALCGACLVEVVEGLQNLSPPTPEEEDAIKRLLITNPRARLSCQARVWGDIRLKTYAHDA